MLEPLETIHESAGSDEQTRSMYSLASFTVREGGTHLDQLFYYWEALRAQGNRPPLTAEFHAREVLPLGADDLVSWVDTRSEDPSKFVMRNHPNVPIGGLGVELSDKTLMEFPNSLHARALISEYHRCKRERMPMYHEIEQVIGGVGRHYTRLMLPLLGEDGSVAAIYYGVRPLARPVRLVYVE